MLYGSVLSLPSPFLDTRQPPSVDFLHQLRMALAALPVVVTNSASAPRSTWVDAALLSCSHVWIRRDGHVKLLTPLYDGPFLVLSRTEKTFTLQVGTRMQVVSVDHLKPVHSEATSLGTSDLCSTSCFASCSTNCSAVCASRDC